MVSGDTGTITIGEASGEYLKTLSNEKRAHTIAEINKFVRWYGRERRFSGLTADEVGNYAERLSQADSDSSKKLDLIKTFLVMAHKEGWTKSNLSLSIKVKKGKVKTLGPTRKNAKEAVPLTQAKYDELKIELENLRTKRISVIGDITRAAADKDLRENAPYHAAREQKSLIEGKIMEIEEILECAEIFDENQKKSLAVCVGDTLILERAGTDQPMQYTLVNPKEVELSKGKISVTSPVGKAALGKLEGATIEVQAPGGKRYFCIKKIVR